MDLDRTFPGLPPLGRWERTDRIAGIEVQRIEDCTWERPKWTCAGTANTTTPLGAKLFEVTTSTTIETDTRGMVWMESGYTGTLVTLAPDGRDVVDGRSPGSAGSSADEQHPRDR